ncbi:hypothetical protein EJV47_27385 [Hymenobacter gummosus]|uniref:Probable zinc-binding domain-containing protein n=1 Tax=Hymenobacter gummosus TaxID=1776032 RepID=A0A431TU75_9BACT|nr:zinc-ribbon domain containing protein [Hymenobacter gummosus]RTQ44718.1 hypothetical protein EJV47_27385 [Hymenobacter gummosus]
MPTIAGQYVSPADCMLRCPCCQRLRDIDEYQTFLRQINALPPQSNVGRQRGRLLTNYYWDAARHQPGTLHWACDQCLEAGRASLGDVSRQHEHCFALPHFAYYDQEKTCRDCGRAFVFSRGEQQHWYEELQFWVEATRVRCPACSRRKHERDRLSRLLAAPDYTDLARTREILQLLLSFGNYARARLYLAQSRKLFAHGSPEYHWLQAWRADINAREQAGPDAPPAAP